MINLSVEFDIKGKPSTLSLSIGPQHPGSGHFRLVITVDGDIITDIYPDPGYVHRGAEKMAEYRDYFQNIPHLERPVIIDSTGITLPFCLAVEKLMDKEAPPRAQYLRIIMAELNRIISHLYWLGIYGPFLGHTTMFMWPMGDRELFIDLAEMIGGQRVTFAYTIPGGVRNDMPENFKDKALKIFDHFERRLKEYDDVFITNPITDKRTKGIGVVKQADAIDIGLTGPNLRASNVKSDIRIDEPYCLYDELDIKNNIPVLSEGDCWARMMIRRIELHESMEIIKKALKKIPDGPVKLPFRGAVRVPEGKIFVRTEAARGVMGYYLISDGGKTPYRVKLSVPSFRSIPGMPIALKNVRIGDMPPIYWSFDYWPVEADK